MTNFTQTTNFTTLSSNPNLRLSSFCWLIILIILTVITAITMASTSTTPGLDKIEPSLRSKLAQGQIMKLMVSFSSTTPVLDNLKVPEGASRGDRATAVNQALNEHMTKSQAGVVKLLQDRGVPFSQFWISNSMMVTGGTLEIARLIAGDPEVVGIREEVVAHLMGNEGENTKK